MRLIRTSAAALACLLALAGAASAYTTYKTVALPSSETAQTVTYAVYDSTGTQVTTGVSGAVVEFGAGTYGAAITVPDGANYFLKWTETTGLLKTAIDTILISSGSVGSSPGASVSRPATPTGLTGSSSGGVVSLTCSAVSGASSYVWTRTDHQTYSTGAPALSDTNTAPGVRYTYTVSAVGPTGLLSAPSASVTVQN